MAKARNVVIYGKYLGKSFHVFSLCGNTNLNIDDGECIALGTVRKYSIVSKTESVNTTSAVGRAVVGAALFGNAGVMAGLSAKHDTIYQIKIDWNFYSEQKESVIEIDDRLFDAFIKGLHYLRPDEMSEEAKSDEELWLDHFYSEKELPYFHRWGRRPHTDEFWKDVLPIRIEHINAVYKLKHPEPLPEYVQPDEITLQMKLGELYTQGLLTPHEYMERESQIHNDANKKSLQDEKVYFTLPSGEAASSLTSDPTPEMKPIVIPSYDPSSGVDAGDVLQQLSDLHDQGILSDHEYATKVDEVMEKL